MNLNAPSEWMKLVSGPRKARLLYAPSPESFFVEAEGIRKVLGPATLGIQLSLCLALGSAWRLLVGFCKLLEKLPAQ